MVLALPGNWEVLLVCSGFEVLVDSCHVQHHVLPIGPFSPHHFINVLREGRGLVGIPGHLMATAIQAPGTGWGLEGLFV